MASSPPRRSTSDVVYDEGYEEVVFVGKDSFQRHYRGGRISQKDKEKDGFMERLSGRALDKYKKIAKQYELRSKDLESENKMLSEAIERLQSDNNKLSEELRMAKKEHEDQLSVLNRVVKECNTVELGENVYVNIVQTSPENDDPIATLEEISKTTKCIIDDISQRLVISENGLNKYYTYLQKKDEVQSPQLMDELKDLVELTKERNEYEILRTAFSSLHAYQGKRRHLEDLPEDVKRGVKLLTYKLGSIPVSAFAKVLGVQLRFADGPINETICAKMLQKFVRYSHENTVEKMIHFVRDIERQHMQHYRQDSLLILKQQIFSTKSSDLLHITGGNQFGGSEISIQSQRSTVSSIEEAYGHLERHASRLLLETSDSPDVKPDTDTYLSAILKMLMDQTKQIDSLHDKMDNNPCRVVNDVKYV